MDKTKHLLGIVCVALYILIASSQSVALNIWLHNVNVFLVVGLSFLIVMVFFSLIALIRVPNSYLTLLANWQTLLLLNVVSLLNWLFYFLSVKYLEPSVAVTLTQGLMPVNMTVWHLFRRLPVSKVSRICHLLICLVVLLMCFYTVMFRAQYSGYKLLETMLGIIIAILCSISLTITIIISRAFAVNQIPASTLLSMRFLLLILLCFGVLSWQPKVELSYATFYAILLIALLGVSASIYILQKGIELATSIAVSTVLALSPLVVFTIQLFNPQIPFSPVIGIMIVIIVIASLVSIVYDTRQIK